MQSASLFSQDSSLSPPLTAPGTSSGGNNDGKKPFKIRAELLAPTRLSPKVQLLHHARSRVIQDISHQVLLLVLACAKCRAIAGKKPPLVGVIGGGHVGSAVVMALLATGYRADRIAVSTRQPDRLARCEALRAPSSVSMFQLVPRYYDNARVARESAILVLCMPPAQLKSVAIQIRHALAVDAAPTLVISTLCGVTLQSLSKAIGSQTVVRVQPDVAKITGPLQQDDQDEEPAQTPPGQDSAAIQQEAAVRRQVLPLRLAAEALAPHREDVERLYTAVARVAGDQAGRLPQVLFGAQAALVTAALQLEGGDSSLVEVPSWPVEWEQDLAELQQSLAHAALSG